MPCRSRCGRRFRSRRDARRRPSVRVIACAAPATSPSCPAPTSRVRQHAHRAPMQPGLRGHTRPPSPRSPAWATRRRRDPRLLRRRRHGGSRSPRTCGSPRTTPSSPSPPPGSGSATRRRHRRTGATRRSLDGQEVRSPRPLHARRALAAQTRERGRAQGAARRARARSGRADRGERATHAAQRQAGDRELGRDAAARDPAGVRDSIHACFETTTTERCRAFSDKANRLPGR